MHTIFLYDWPMSVIKIEKWCIIFYGLKTPLKGNLSLFLRAIVSHMSKLEGLAFGILFPLMWPLVFTFVRKWLIQIIFGLRSSRLEFSNLKSYQSSHSLFIWTSFKHNLLELKSNTRWLIGKGYKINLRREILYGLTLVDHLSFLSTIYKNLTERLSSFI